ncbi:MAG: transcriptional regulator, partial [Deltaproteobacteria bacterium]
MELNKSTRFALYAAVEMARHPGEAVSASQIAE